jgi:hypothetical protein
MFLVAALEHRPLATVCLAITQIGAPSPSPQANFLSRAMARCSKPIYENFPLGPIEVRIPGITVLEHCRLRGCRFLSAWSAEHHRFTKVSVISLATAATLLACSALAYVQFVRPIAAFDYRVGACGLLLSFFRHHLGVGHPPLPALVFFTGARRFGMDACAVFSGWFPILKAQHGVESRIGETPPR